MSTPGSELDKHLQALFGGLDTRTDFDARLMARLRAESHRDTTARAARARQQERARYGRAVRELQSWRRSMLRLLTLDTLGIAILLVVAVVTAGPHLRQDVIAASRHYGPYLAILAGVVVAAVTLLGIRVDQTRRPIRLL
jgi:negative regulator of sigma E activity